MHQGKLVFSQLMAYLPLSTFRRCVATHRGEHKVQDFTLPIPWQRQGFCRTRSQPNTIGRKCSRVQRSSSSLPPPRRSRR